MKVGLVFWVFFFLRKKLIIDRMNIKSWLGDKRSNVGD